MSLSMRCFCLLLGTLLCVGAAPAPSVPTSSPAAAIVSFVPLPGGLADPAGRVGYLSNAHGGIDAVDLRTGDLLWDTHEAQRPVLLAGSRLIAQAGTKRNRLRVFAFDLLQKGECVLESDPVVLPAWVVTADGPGRSFEARWRLEKNILVLAWEASAWYSGPTHPTPQQEAAARRHAAGVAHIDLDTGQVETSPPEKMPDPPPSPADNLEKMSVRWQGAIGGRYYAMTFEELPSSQRLLLRAWGPDGRAAAPIELAQGKHLLAHTSLDGRFLCVREAVPPPDDKGMRKIGEEHAWRLFYIETGQQVARLPYENGAQTISIVGGRAFYTIGGAITGPLDRPLVQPRVLKTFDLKTGKLAWQRAIAGRTVAPAVR